MLWEVLPLSKPPSPQGSHRKHRPAPQRLGEQEPSLHFGDASWGKGGEGGRGGEGRGGGEGGIENRKEQ